MEGYKPYFLTFFGLFEMASLFYFDEHNRLQQKTLQISSYFCVSWYVSEFWQELVDQMKGETSSNPFYSCLFLPRLVFVCLCYLVFICLSQSLSASERLCQFLLFFVCLCQTLSVSISLCLYLLVFVRICQSLSATACLRLPQLVFVCSCSYFSASASLCLPLLFFVCI